LVIFQVYYLPLIGYVSGLFLRSEERREKNNQSMASNKPEK
jgi:hypothetical protein